MASTQRRRRTGRRGRARPRPVADMPLRRSSARFHRIDPVVGVDDGQAVVERLEDVLVELAHALDLVGLRLELLVEAPVLDARSPPARPRPPAAPCPRCSAARRAPCARGPARRCAVCLDTHGNQVVHALVAPELDLVARQRGAAASRVVERHVVARPSRARRRPSRGAAAAARRRTRRRGSARNAPADSSATISAMRSMTSVSRDARDEALAQPGADRDRC